MFGSEHSGVFLCRVTAKTGSGATATYSFSEYWLTAAGTFSAKSGGRYGTAATNPGMSATGADLAVNDYALCRSAQGAAGLKWELYPLPTAAAGGMTGTGTDNHAARWDGTGVSAIQDSRVVIGDDGSIQSVSTSESISLTLYDSASLGYVNLSRTQTTGGVTWYFDDSSHAGGFSLDTATGNVTAQVPGATGKFLLTGDALNASTPAYSIKHNATTHNGFTGTCTVQVGGVNKTMTITGGIVTNVA